MKKLIITTAFILASALTASANEKPTEFQETDIQLAFQVDSVQQLASVQQLDTKQMQETEAAAFNSAAMWRAISAYNSYNRYAKYVIPTKYHPGRTIR